MKRIAVVVVTYNRINLLQECIKSIRLQTYQDYSIIVVNNGSTDGTLEWLNRQKDVTIITQKNLGGAGGFYTGLKFATEQGYDYCWIMDDDVICESTALEELIKAYHVQNNIGFICSRVIGINGESMNTPAPDMRPEDNGYANFFDKVVNYAMVKIRTATFVSVLLSTNRIIELGLPLREFFIWGDDVEYTERISSLYPSYVACRSIVIHKRYLQKALIFDEETDLHRLNNYFYAFRNHAYTDLKNHNIKGFMHVLIKQFFRLIKFICLLKFRHAIIICKAYFSLPFFHAKIEYPSKKM